MSLWINVRSVKYGGRQLDLYTSGGKYSLKYKTGNQNIDLKSNIQDEGYANYLFDKFLEDLHMKENLIQDKKLYKIHKNNISANEEVIRELLVFMHVIEERSKYTSDLKDISNELSNIKRLIGKIK